MNLESESDDEQKRGFFGRRQGRPLSAARQDLLDSFLPQLDIPPDALSRAGQLDPRQLFDFTPTQIWLEIGFGSGEHLSSLMKRHPENGFIGAEPFTNGMTSFLKDIKDAPHHHNIRVLMDDAMILTRALGDQSIDGIYVLNPDPWHKKRHHKRRIINPRNLDVFARILKPGGQMIMSTDVPDLAEWMVTKTINHPAFRWTAQSADDWRKAPPDWIPTRYETKRAKGASHMTYLLFQKSRR